VNASRISCLNLTSLVALFVFLLCRLTSGEFTIDSSTPTLTRNLNEHPILVSFFINEALLRRHFKRHKDST
jgi:hypothetical protein